MSASMSAQTTDQANAITPGRWVAEATVRTDRFLGPIESNEIAEVAMRLSVERYRIIDALDRAERDAYHLRQDRDDWKRIAEAWREQNDVLKDGYAAQEAETQRAWSAAYAHAKAVDKLERKLAKAKARGGAR